MNTEFCTKYGLEVPIVQAPIGLQSGAALAASVSNAGGLGTLSMSDRDTDDCRNAVRATKALTGKPFATNFVLEYPHEELIEICPEELFPENIVKRSL